MRLCCLVPKTKITMQHFIKCRHWSAILYSWNNTVFKINRPNKPNKNKEDIFFASEARKRSYLVGSVGPTSLLGTQELERQFPDRTIRYQQLDRQFPDRTIWYQKLERQFPDRTIHQQLLERQFPDRTTRNCTSSWKNSDRLQETM